MSQATHRRGFGRGVVGAIGAICVLAGAAAGQEAATATLKMEPTALDPAGSREMGMMYMPSGFDLTAEQPEFVTKAPEFRTTPRWGVISIGSGEGSTRAIVVDEPEGEPARIWLDLNGNGDLTDDNDGEWPTSSTNDDGITNYSGTFVFDVRWDADGKTSEGQYGLNLYYSPVRDRINYYRAGMRTGEIVIEGETYRVRLIENDNDARFSKKFAPDAVFDADTMTKPVWVAIGGDRFDARATFQHGGVNYEPFISDDGSTLTIKPTFRVINVPRPTETRPEMLAAGAEAPQFAAMLWTGSDNNGEKQIEFAELAKDKIVVLDLWATWCGPCKAGLPHLSRIAEKVKGQDVQVIALNVYDDEAAYRRFIQANDYAFDWARDPAGREHSSSIAAQKFNVFAIPATFVIGKDGKVAAAISGYRAGDRSLEAALEKLGVKLAD